MHKAREVGLKSIEKAQDTQKEKFNKRAQDLKLEIGQTVTMKRFKPAPNTMFASHWAGVFRIVDLDDNSHAKIQSLYNPTAQIKKVHVDQLKPYYRPVGEPAMTDVNFDVEKHIAENVIRPENVETQKAEENPADGTQIPPRDVNQDQENDFGLNAKPLETDTSDNETEGRARKPQIKRKVKQPQAQKVKVPREQILKRYQTVSIPKTTEKTRSGRQIKPVERLNLSATKSG